MPDRTPRKKIEQFLKLYGRCGIAAQAARAVGIHPHTIVKWRKVNKHNINDLMEMALARYQNALRDMLDAAAQEDNRVLLKLAEAHLPEHKKDKSSTPSTQKPPNIVININGQPTAVTHAPGGQVIEHDPTPTADQFQLTDETEQEAAHNG